MTYEVYKNWHNMDLPSKLNYLLLDLDWNELIHEFKSIQYPSEDDNDVVSRATFVSFMEDFQEENVIDIFWRECDSDMDGNINLIEYACCRGGRDKYGNYFDKNEYDYREEVVLSDFGVALQRGEVDIFEYDEDGIIID